MRLNSELTAQQQQILVLLAQGKTINAAAEAANIHRNTIANWRRSSETFRKQWHSMQYEQAMHWRDEMQSMAQIAVDAILKTLTDEKTPPGVRLRAALAVLNKVTAVAPAQPELQPSQTQAAGSLRNVAQSAQSCTTEVPDLPGDLGPLDDEALDSLLRQMCLPPHTHNHAQPPLSSPGKSNIRSAQAAAGCDDAGPDRAPRT